MEFAPILFTFFPVSSPRINYFKTVRGDNPEGERSLFDVSAVGGFEIMFWYCSRFISSLIEYDSDGIYGVVII